MSFGLRTSINTHVYILIIWGDGIIGDICLRGHDKDDSIPRHVFVKRTNVVLGKVRLGLDRLLKIG